MTNELDLENLKNLQEHGKIKARENLEEIADQLPAWRKSEAAYDREKLAKYGRNEDLNRLVNDPDWNVRQEVARRGRDKDLDKLVNDPDPDVREQVAWAGRNRQESRS